MALSYEVVFMGTIFVAGVYGVGKSTLCGQLASILGIPAYSAGDLISQVNGEIYGVNKVVQDKSINQDILALVVDEKLKHSSTILLAGHFCIFDKHNHVDKLPSDAFKKLHIQQILLLEADENRIIQNLNRRDGKHYTAQQVSSLLIAEREAAKEIARINGYRLSVHKMGFDEDDIHSCLSLLK